MRTEILALKTYISNRILCKIFYTVNVKTFIKMDFELNEV